MMLFLICSLVFFVNQGTSGQGIGQRLGFGGRTPSRGFANPSCLVPLRQRATCGRTRLRWHYSARNRRCEETPGPVCPGPLNNFPSAERCREACLNPCFNNQQRCGNCERCESTLGTARCVADPAASTCTSGDPAAAATSLAVQANSGTNGVCGFQRCDLSRCSCVRRTCVCPRTETPRRTAANPMTCGTDRCSADCSGCDFQGRCTGGPRCVIIVQPTVPPPIVSVVPRPTAACAFVRCPECTRCELSPRGIAVCARKNNCCTRGEGRRIACFVDPCRQANRYCPAANTCVSSQCQNTGCLAHYYDRQSNEICTNPSLPTPPVARPPPASLPNCGNENCDRCQVCQADIFGARCVPNPQRPLGCGVSSTLAVCRAICGRCEQCALTGSGSRCVRDFSRVGCGGGLGFIQTCGSSRRVCGRCERCRRGRCRRTNEGRGCRRNRSDEDRSRRGRSSSERRRIRNRFNRRNRESRERDRNGEDGRREGRRRGDRDGRRGPRGRRTGGATDGTPAPADPMTRGRGDRQTAAENGRTRGGTERRRNGPRRSNDEVNEQLSSALVSTQPSNTTISTSS